MELFGIEASRPAHDALGDAYHTALICARLDLKRGAAEYDEALKSHENGFHGAELPGCIARKVFYDYPDKRAPTRRTPPVPGAAAGKKALRQSRIRRRKNKEERQRGTGPADGKKHAG